MRAEGFARIAMYDASNILPGHGRFCRLFAAALLSLFCIVCSPASAQTPISLFNNFVGHVDYRATGNSLRSSPNTTNACALNGSSSASITGIPAGASILAGYLYWAGSGSTPDNSVTLNGSGVAAERSFTDTFLFSGNNYDFFSGFADVSSLISGNGVYTFSSLSVDNGGQYCSSQAVVAGWSLVVIYEHPGEDLRTVNVFDGFQLFRADSLTLTVDTYRIPVSPINGRVTPITWEGDPQNSGGSGGFSESLLFNGNLLDDGLVPPASSPSVQQFDGTVNTAGSTTAYGVDIDTYDVSAFLSPGDTSATMTYSSGADLVLLSAEIISFTTEPVVDLQISKSHSGSFAVGTPGEYTVAVTNNGPEDDANPILVTDTLPAGLIFASHAGSGWTCSVSGSDVNCAHPGPLPAGGTLPDLTVSVDVTAAAAGSVTNVIDVSSASVDLDPGNNQATDPTIVIASDLSTSTKSVIDLNGGDSDPGDTLRYTIRLVESGGVAASDITVTDDIPSFIDSFSLVALPPGTIDNSTGPGTGANLNGYIDLQNISVPAGGAADIVFDAIVAGSASPGDIIANQANVVNPGGAGSTPSAPDIIVSAAAIPGGGTKTLYLFDSSTPDPNGFTQGLPPWLSRTPPSTPQGNVSISNLGSPVTWTMTPALQAPLTIDAGTIPVTLYVARNGRQFFGQRRLQVALSATGSVSGPLGTPVTQQFSAPPLGSATELTFNIPLSSVTTLPIGTQIALTLTNVTPGSGFPRLIYIEPSFSGNSSRIDLPALTVINVNTTTSFDAGWPGGSAAASFTPGAVVSLRADVSDPFGTFDISSVSIDVLDNSGTLVVTGQPMTLVDSLSGSTAQYEYLLALPGGAAGNWSWRVTATEGTEGLVTHQRTGSFFIAVPQLTFTKAVNVLQDPINGAINPKAIPGAVMLYSITLANSGPVGIDADTLQITDRLPPETSLFVDSSSGDPIAFIDGTPGSGMTFDYASAVGFSNQPDGGAPYTYTPTPDAQGFDPAVTGIAITPAGALAGSSSGGAAAPSFTLRYRTRLE
jgi:uncharacterized repeat protein (TIGR01451 family)